MSEQKTNSFSIIEILQYVRKNAQSGRLLFDEKGVTLAELYFNKGHLVHARNDKVTGDDVVYQLLSNRTAKINWQRNIQPPEETVSKTDEVLLLGALGILTEDDAANVMDVVSREAEQAMDNAFEEAQAAPTPVATAPIAQAPVATVPVIPNNTAPVAPVAPVQETRQPLPVAPVAAAETVTAPPSEVHSPVLGSSPITIEGLGRLQALLGDEVLRPPRFPWLDWFAVAVRQCLFL